MPSIRTTSIIEPPVRNGGIASSGSRRPNSTPMPVRAEHLMAGEGQEVHAERGHVDRLVRHRLGAVGEHQRALLVRRPGDLGDRRDRAGHVGLVGHRDDLGALGDQLVEVQVEPPSGVTRNQRRVAPVRCAQLLPGHQVGVVLKLGDQDLVAGADGTVGRSRCSCSRRPG